MAFFETRLTIKLSKLLQTVHNLYVDVNGPLTYIFLLKKTLTTKHLASICDILIKIFLDATTNSVSTMKSRKIFPRFIFRKLTSWRNSALPQRTPVRLPRSGVPLAVARPVHHRRHRRTVPPLLLDQSNFVRRPTPGSSLHFFFTQVATLNITTHKFFTLTVSHFSRHEF